MEKKTEIIVVFLLEHSSLSSINQMLKNKISRYCKYLQSNLYSARFCSINRNALIEIVWEKEFYKYIKGVVQNKEQKVIVINAMPDHLHIFIGMKPSCCISDLVWEVKKSSNASIKENELAKALFIWQEGFCASSCSHSHIDSVYKYVMNQKEHHQKQTVTEEYLDFLEKFEVEYDGKYLFNWIEFQL
jgi:REP element-mobilizing transposase RayT